MNQFKRKGRPLIYAFDKFRTRKCEFLYCHICMGLHELHSNALLIKREVKIAGYWPSSFVPFSWTETKSRSIKTQKKTEFHIQPS